MTKKELNKLRKKKNNDYCLSKNENHFYLLKLYDFLHSKGYSEHFFENKNEMKCLKPNVNYYYCLIYDDILGKYVPYKVKPLYNKDGSFQSFLDCRLNGNVYIPFCFRSTKKIKSFCWLINKWLKNKLYNYEN